MKFFRESWVFFHHELFPVSGNFRDSASISYVDALGKSVLRIHNVQVTYSDNTGASSTITGNEVGVAQWQLTTQSQASLVRSDNRSVVSDGRVHMFNDQGTAKLASTVTDANGINVQEWTNGYLIAVEQIVSGIR